MGDHPVRLAALSFTCVLFFAGHASAIPLLELVDSPRPDQPFAGRSLGTGGAAAYFNPARLSTSERTFDASYLALWTNLNVELAPRPAGYDVSEDVYFAREVVNGEEINLDFRPLPTAKLPPRSAQRDDGGLGQSVLISLSMPIVDNLLSVGLSSVLVLDQFQNQTPFFSDERGQFFGNQLHYELYGDRLESTAFSLGFGLALGPMLSLGVGASLVNHAESLAQVYVPDAGDQGTVYTNPQVTIESSYAPHFGLVFRPFGDTDLELSSTVHLPSFSELNGQTEIYFWKYEYPEGQDYLQQSFDLNFFHEPMRVGLGGKGDLQLSGGRVLTLYGDALWSRWSAYMDRHRAVTRDWHDVVSLKFGSQLSLGEHTAGLGLLYAPTPVPQQDGRTNYVDNERVGGQFGWRWTMPHEEVRLGFALGVQVQRLLPRAHAKKSNASDPVFDSFPDSIDVRTQEPLAAARGLQTNNPGFPGFAHDGWLVGTFLSVSVEH